MFAIGQQDDKHERVPPLKSGGRWPILVYRKNRMTPVLQTIPRPGATGFRLSDELIAALRQKVDSRYYDRPEIIEIIARAILVSRGVYL
jgi:hypothetical protein